MNFTRNCPRCGKKIVYYNYDSLKAGEYNNSNCRVCGMIVRRQHMKERGFVFNPRKDLTGKIINCWEVLKFSEKREKFYYWDVKCTNCGMITTKETSHINKTKRCRHCHRMKKGESGLNNLFCRYAKAANRTKRKFEISKNKFLEITSSPCYYCGAEPSKIASNNYYLTSKKSHWGDYTYNGIDRIDNSLGYNEKNCVSCCTICNWAKNARGADEFKKYIVNICKNAKNGRIPFIQDSING